ncbi:MAG: hypothetical protein OJI67_22505, partial [Prosthecobacter sp.]|nr:hypothetical protein [Prosthecobacter sp.]
MISDAIHRQPKIKRQKIASLFNPLFLQEIFFTRSSSSISEPLQALIWSGICKRCFLTRRLSLLALSSCLLSFASCGEQRKESGIGMVPKPTLPEVYGFYLHSGEEVIRFDTDKDLQSQYTRTGKTSILIFDRRLQSPDLRLEEQVQLWRMVPVRFDVTTVHEQSNGPVVDYLLEPVNQYSTLEPALPYVVKPVKGKMDMVELIPQVIQEGGSLEPGIYGFRFFDDEILLFGVGLNLKSDSTIAKSAVGAAAMLMRPETNPHDRYAKVVAKQPGGYWSQFRASMDHSQSGGSFRNGKPVERSWLAPSAELDALELSWRNEMRKWLDSREYMRAQKLVDRLTTLNPANTELQSDLDQVLLEYARVQLKDHPLIASALAYRVSSASRHFTEARDIFTKGINSSKAEHNRLLDEKTQWNNKVHQDGDLLAQFKYVSDCHFMTGKDVIGEVFIHRFRLKFKIYESSDDISWRHLGVIGALESYDGNHEIGVLDVKHIPFYGLKVLPAGLGDPIAFEFRKKSD